MMNTCKFCHGDISHINQSRDWCCPKCEQYSVSVNYNQTVITETLRSGNFYLIFFPVYKTASIVSTSDDDKKIIHSFDMDEFNEEQAAHWAKKLKTYVVFQ